MYTQEIFNEIYKDNNRVGTDVKERSRRQNLYANVVKKRIKKYGKRAVEEMMKEFRNLDKVVIPVKLVVEPVDPNILMTKDKEKALAALNSFKNLIAEIREECVKMVLINRIN